LGRLFYADTWQLIILGRFDLAHPPAVQADPRMDRAEALHPRCRPPLDLAAHRRAHPTPAGPAPRRRSTPTLGTSRRTGSAHPGPGPPRVSEHPPDEPAHRPRAQTQPTRPRTPTRLPQPTPRTQPGRRQDGQTRP